MARQEKDEEKARIFISHSAKEPEAKAVQEALKEALKASGRYTVLLDIDTLQPGDRWRFQINLWLGACDAAVVLLSKAALESAYVTYETSVLAYRNATLDQAFLIIPVLLDDVSAEALRHSYLSAAQLDERQIVRGSTGEIVAKILKRLAEAKFCHQTPAEKRAGRIAELLREVPDEGLRQAAAKLDLELPWMAEAAQRRLRVAMQLMSVGMRKSEDALLLLRKYVAASALGDWLQEMVEQVGSSWVDLRSVGRIPSIAKGHEKVRSFGINARSLDSARMYLLCASYEDEKGTWTAASCSNIHGEEAGELAGEIRMALKAALSVPDEDLAWELGFLEKRQRPVVVTLDRAGVTEEVLAELRQQFPSVAFFLLTGAELDNRPLLPAALVEMLFPPLLEGEERSFLGQYKELRHSLMLRPGAL